MTYIITQISGKQYLMELNKFYDVDFIKDSEVNDIIKLNKVLWIITKQNPFKDKTFYSLPQRIARAKKITINTKKIQIVNF